MIASFRISLSSAETVLKLLATCGCNFKGQQFYITSVAATVAAICTVVAAIVQWHDTLDCSIQGLVQLLTETTATLGKLFNWLFTLAQLLTILSVIGHILTNQVLRCWADGGQTLRRVCRRFFLVSTSSPLGHTTLLSPSSLHDQRHTALSSWRFISARPSDP